MNLSGISINRKETVMYYKNSHRRFQVKAQFRNMNKEQTAKVERALQKIINDILPEREGKT